MASLNRVVLIGNLTRDVEVRSTPDGKPVANLGLAVNRPWTNKEGQREADYFTIVAWRRLAELCAQYLSKGSPVAIEGRLQSRSWETAEGQKRSTVEVVADNVQFLSRSTGPVESQEQPIKEEASEQTQKEEASEQTQKEEASEQTQPETEETKDLEKVAADNSDSDELPDDDVPF